MAEKRESGEPDIEHLKGVVAHVGGDVSTQALNTAKARILPCLIIFLMSTLFASASQEKPGRQEGAEHRGLIIFQKNISFGQVPIGATEDNYFVTVVNNGTRAVTLQEAKAEAPFSVLFNRPLKIDPATFASFKVLFKPRAEGSFSGKITITADNGQTLTVPASGKGIRYGETRPEQWVQIQLTKNSFIITKDAYLFTGTFNTSLKPGIPYALRRGVLKLDIEGVGGGGELTMNSAQTDLRSGQPVGFRIKFKPGSLPPPLKLVGKAILLDETGKEVFTYLSPPIIWQQAPPEGEPLPCGCAPQPPTPVVLASKTSYFPNSPIASGDPPGATADKVAEVKVTIKGPSVGTCCDPSINFDFNLQISSDFALPAGAIDDNDITAHQLIRACRGLRVRITANTNRIEHEVTSAPGSTFGCPVPLPGEPALTTPGTPIGRVILETNYQEQIKCEKSGKCPCVVDTSLRRTVVLYAGGQGGLQEPGEPILPAGTEGAGQGSIMVVWQVGLGAGAGDCITGQATATILRVLFLRGNDVYDPDRHSLGWLNMDGNPDGDNRNNLVELLYGRNPYVID
jgi:hypothetical protein